MIITTLDILPTLIIQLLVLIGFKLLNSVNGELIVLTKLSLKEGLFEENAKTNDVSAESSLILILI
jgi:hypothetical protein